MLLNRTINNKKAIQKWFVFLLKYFFKKKLSWGLGYLIRFLGMIRLKNKQNI